MFSKIKSIIMVFKSSPFLLALSIAAMLTLFSNISIAQDNLIYTEGRTKLVKLLKKKFISNRYTKTIEHFYFTTCDSLINKKVTLENKPVRDMLIRLFAVSFEKLRKKQLTALRIAALNYHFLLTVKGYQKESVNNIYQGIGISQCNILQSVFTGLLLGDSIRTIVGLREMEAAPNFIISRIRTPEYLPYKDSLLYLLANNAPDLLAKQLAANDPLFTELVNGSNRMTVKAVTAMKMDNYYDKIVPFGVAIMEKRVTVDEIRNLTLTPREYYHAFTEEILRLRASADPEIRSFLKHPVADLNGSLSNKYFIDEINEKHESPDKVRFQVIDNLSVRELYFLILGGSSELYTSSFLYVYKKFLKETEKTGLDKFFEDIDYYKFDQVLLNIAGYGLVDNLISRLNEKKVAGIISKYLNKLPNKKLSDNDIILNAMSMAEVLYEIRDHPVIKAALIAQIDKIENAPGMYNYLMYQRMYDGFKKILMNKTSYNSDEAYDVLAIKRLQKENLIVQACFFYDDEDAGSSFYNSTASYNAREWDKADFGNYIVFSSRSGNNVKVFMNKPKTTIGCDSAQNEMLKTIEQKGYVITSFIHRGHSYFLSQSLRKVSASGQFVFLGSCGGYNEVLKVFQLNPDVNVIATRNIGSKMINDPLLERINRDMVNNKDINWDLVWKEFNSRFQSKLTKDLFSSYIPPNRYIGIKFIREVFNY